MQLPNPYGENDAPKPDGDSGGLVDWIMRRVENARRVRDAKNKSRWDEYTRLWRGHHISSDKNNESERSKLVAPALQQAVEMTVAEMEEAAFNRIAWFDITDDIKDENRDDAVAYRDQLLEDYELDNVKDSASDVFLLGAIYGTGIGKINTVKRPERFIEDGKEVSRDRIAVTLSAIRPDQFLIDPAALTIDEALFVGDETLKPLHGIREKQRSGVYRKAPLSAWTGPRPNTDGTGAEQLATEDDGVLITEYAGRIPSKFLPGAEGNGPMTEALVTIANEKVILKAVANPFTMKDRPYLAYQHDTIPGEFWGRGVCEKGYNPQKALDAELRARIDTLALITAPMMGADVTRLPRNPDMKVRPGKTIFTRGRPSEIYEPITFGNPAILAHTFQHSGDLERMVQMGTGAMDSATPVGVNARNETASGISQLQAGFIKRSKRTMQNVDRNFMTPLVRKGLWRYMQFAPDRYEVDMKFVVNSTMGIMAKEVENSQLTNMLGFLTPDDPARAILIQAIFENSASANKKELKEAVAQMNRPPSPEEQAEQAKIKQLQMQTMEAEAQLKVAEAQKEAALAEKAAAEAKLALERARHERIEADLEDDLVDIAAANAATGAQKTREQARQTDVAKERNEIERIKATQKGSQKTDS